MGTFVFKWAHAASEVYVTGTFDNWSKSEKLIKTGDIFEKNVTLPSAEEKIYYKVRRAKPCALDCQSCSTQFKCRVINCFCFAAKSAVEGY